MCSPILNPFGRKCFNKSCPYCYTYLKYCVVFSDVHIPGTVSKNTSSWDVSVSGRPGAGGGKPGATADMHCDGSRDLGWRETGGQRVPPSNHCDDCIDRVIKGPVYRISLGARMSIILSHSEVLLGQNHRNLNCVSMHINIYFWILYSKNMHRDTIQMSNIVQSINIVQVS